MDIFPAIDLHEGKCVRLFKGDFSQSTTFSDTPEAVAKEFEACGAHYL
ncbi:MAG: 1-(5-phosphoribosyl)-5-((5-phosphoribosylamino)methylideneamino)imidazole-4-carboxamide isomerase, partial [Schwartzia sp.]|nr:1-(5-phosphoribosyl)-5-((5-phosphoribosylamino)methylideneamino)imidazole-4-carboxamide isomerase [Schwartzia sp. (in: firmicutes)]